MFDVLLLKNKSFVFFHFWFIPLGRPSRNLAAGGAASRKCWKLPHGEAAAAGKSGCGAGPGPGARGVGRGAPPSSLRALKALLVANSDRTHGGSLHHSFCLLTV